MKFMIFLIGSLVVLLSSVVCFHKKSIRSILFLREKLLLRSQRIIILSPVLYTNSILMHEKDKSKEFY
jgi:hypothetical protein